MSKLKKGDNPTPYVAEVRPEKDKLRIPPDKYAIAVAPLDLKSNSMKLTGVDTYTFKEMPDGMVYRISKNGVEYPPITKEQFEGLKNLHEKYMGQEYTPMGLVDELKNENKTLKKVQKGKSQKNQDREE